MNKRMILPLIFGLLGSLVLIWLGVWQLQRLAWKAVLVANITARMDQPIADLPVAPDKATDIYCSLRLSGTLEGPELHVLTSLPPYGPGFRVIQPFVTTEGRRVMLDRGFVVEAQKHARRPLGPVEVTGALHWPNETDGFTPQANLERNIWFARDVDLMAKALGTEPVLIVSATDVGENPPFAQPVTVWLPDNHLQYALTWFSLALVWLVMTGYWIIRIRRKTA